MAPVRRREEAPPKPFLEVPHDSLNEIVVIAAAMVDPDARAWLTTQVREELFLDEQHRAIWGAMLEVERRKLDYDPALLVQCAGGKVKASYLDQALALRPEAPDRPNLEHHVETMRWDHQRAVAVRGPLASLVEALGRPQEPRERVAALARHVGESFSGGGRTSLRDPRALVGSMMGELRKRMGGKACYPYGIDGLDFYEQGAVAENGDDLSGRHRLTPGAAPGQVTVITAISGGGKSTVAAQIALGIARQRRRVLYGAWEPGSEMTLELMACIALGWSRSDFAEGRFTAEDLVTVEEKAHAISQFVVLMDNPFQRQRGERESNARNLDTIHQHIVDSGCEVFFADLWDRCLVDDDPGEEKRALWRQHAIAEETRTHNVLLAQQRLKDIETRPDKRPTREGIKGSAAWVEMPETIIAPHWPYKFKKVSPNLFEIIVSKQRWGRWPLVVEFDWESDTGRLEGGRSVPFEHVGESSDEGTFIPPQPTKGGGRRWGRKKKD